MAVKFGIASLVIALLGVLVPAVATLYVIWIALVLAVVSGLLGRRIFAFATFFVCLMNFLFLSPMMWLTLAGESSGSFRFVATVFMFLDIIVVLIMRSITPYRITRTS